MESELSVLLIEDQPEAALGRPGGVGVLAGGSWNPEAGLFIFICARRSGTGDGEATHQGRVGCG